MILSYFATIIATIPADFAIRLRNLTFFVTILALTGCVNSPFVQQPQETNVCVGIRWIKSGYMCGDHPSAGCAQMLGEGSYTLHLVKPESWDDSLNLYRAGHELMHALGASHP